MIDNAEKLMWKYLLTHGAVITSRDYYGVQRDLEKTDYCCHAIDTDGIDWDKTEGVKDDTDMEFNGTFNEPAYIHFLEGMLYTNDGSEWHWFYEYDEPINVLELIKDIIPDPFEK